MHGRWLRLLLIGGILLATIPLSVVTPRETVGATPPVGGWRVTNSMGIGRAGHTATLLPNGKVLVAGGLNNGSSALASAEIYDPLTGQWAATASMNSARVSHTATLLPNGKVLVAGGSGLNTGALASAEMYDSQTGQWTLTGSMARGRTGHTATLLPSGKVLTLGASTSLSIHDAELFDPNTIDPISGAAGRWTLAGAPHYGHSKQSAILLKTNRVLVLGGVTDAGLGVGVCELYDPVANTWTDTATAPTDPVDNTATLLNDGRVLVAGDNLSLNHDSPRAFLYQPSSGTWSETASMAEARSSHTASLLPNGAVMVVGDDVTAGAEQFDPATGTWSRAGAYPLHTSSNATATALQNGAVLVTGGQVVQLTNDVFLTATAIYSSAPISRLNLTSVGFGAQPVGAADTRIVIVNNDGGVPMNVSTVSATPADAFSVSGTTCTSQPVAAGGSCTITVRFQPPAGQAYTATLNVFDDATNSPNTASLSGSGSFAGGPAPSFFPISVDFGNVPLDASVNGYHSVRLTNAGSQPLRVDSLTLATTGNGADFAIVDFRCQGRTLAPGDYCVIYLKFHPGATGGRSGTLKVFSNANADPNVPTTLALSGAGFNGSAPLARLREEFTDVGSQSIGTTGGAQTVYLQNSGNGPLTVSSVSVPSDGGNTGDFAVDASACTAAAVTAGNQCPLSVFFSPTAVGSRKAFLSVNESASDGAQLLYLAGTGTAATGPAATLSPQRVDFGNQATTGASNAALVTLTNVGTTALNIASIAIPDSTEFSQTNTCVASLAPNASCSISVTFHPTQQTGRSGTLTITDNAAGSPHYVPLTGIGVAAGGGTPVLDTFSFRGPVNYGDVPVNGHLPAFIPVHNTGTAPLVVTSCTLSNGDDFTIDSGCPVTVAPNASSDLHVGGIPRALGTRTTTLTITDNASGSPHSIVLTENGTGAPVASLPASLDAGNQPVSTTSDVRTVSLHNIGNVPLTVSGVATTGEFSQTNACATVATAATCTISVRFAPTALGQRAGTLTITDDAAGSPHTVALSGTGTPPPPKVVRLSTLSVPVAGGAQVTITGTGFQPGVVVFFGDAAGTIVGTPTGTSIVAATPVHAAGTVDVTVANPDGQYSDVYTGFSFVPPGGAGPLPPGQPVVPTTVPKPAPVPIGTQPAGTLTGPTPAPVPVAR